MSLANTIEPTEPSSSPNDAVAIEVSETAGLRRVREPVTCGICLPKGWAPETAEFTLADRNGQAVECQSRIIRRWKDASPQLIQLTWLADVDAGEQTSYLVGQTSAPRAAGDSAHALHSPATIQFGEQEICFEPGRDCLFSVRQDASSEPSHRCRMAAGVSAREMSAIVDSANVEEHGCVFTTVRLTGKFGRSPLRFTARVTLYASLRLVQIQTTLENPQRARHAGGYWDLGDAGSILLNDVVLRLESCKPYSKLHWQQDVSTSTESGAPGTFEIQQASSGGDQWASRNHRDDASKPHLPFRGFRASSEGHQIRGLRANPSLCVVENDSSIACSLTEFWQKFPSSIGAKEQSIEIGILPSGRQLHELLGGEHCTRRAWLDFADADAEPNRLAWTHVPLVPATGAQELARRAGVGLTLSDEGPLREEYQEIRLAALEGADSFFSKREAIDEYGWRNFGDMWADHEGAYYEGPRPVISHYNNQYDLLQTLLLQFLSTGDPRWWNLADPLARHVMDIDIYHSRHDKPAYSGGMFWHTAHYHDAATSCHRSYSKQMRNSAMPAPGGGPANEHIYSTGLLLYYWLTGDVRAREVVERLADWVVNMDDGRQHLLGLVSDAPTGGASCTGEPDFHGPGRGAGNAVSTLLDGWLSTGEQKYLTLCEALIRRTIHPRDDIEKWDLLDSEERWSYTVYLHVLGRFLELTADVTSMQACRLYARDALLHYAEWMAAHERLSLDEPDRLEFPTETWAAQDLRKGNVLLMAATYESDLRRSKLFRERGTRLLDQAWSQLNSYDTRSYTRPMAIALQQGMIESYFSTQTNGGSNWHEKPSGPHDFGTPADFMSQKDLVKQQLRSPGTAARLALRAMQPSRWKSVLRYSWAAHLGRKWLGRYE